MKLHVLREAKPILNRAGKNHWILLRDVFYEPLKKAQPLSIEEIPLDLFQFNLSGSYPLFFSDSDASHSLFMHESILPILENHNIQVHKLLPFKAQLNQQELNYFLFNYHQVLDIEDINYTETEFGFYKLGKLQFAGTKFSSYDHLNDELKKLRKLKHQEQYRLSKLVFKNEEYNQLDLFRLKAHENRMILSDKLYTSILNLKPKKLGLDFMDFLKVQSPSVSPNYMEKRKHQLEKPDPIDFKNLTNLNIERRIIRDYKQLENYFSELNLLDEIKADAYTKTLQLDPELEIQFHKKKEELFKLHKIEPSQNLISTAKKWLQAVNKFRANSKLPIEIIVLGTSFENQCFYTEFLYPSESNTQIEIGDLSFYLTWHSDNAPPFDQLPHLSIFKDENWLQLSEDYESLPCFEKLIALHHNVLWKLFYNTFQAACVEADTKPIALSFEYYDKEDLDFIYI